ncbi:uncharacterized protein LOC112348452 isoform X1 [Selaginella moellendorffii]|uniref:uncharacterized protein LOC112348452 isoform X1 n=1 Tax=Selaginella moellendorffii TaxID=88036 RepID=UPI000D1D00DB|nr:uncharacterized protein LOC112348452 isoform X1 [Selaginella moellendorffii]XP_024536718.1 uncharacterized protein LOC112348452 isoform X1 [Selaginella moellendorffii]|eukprot:XP_024536717.1 uncharacterized protein LOC112348452 isoform X1 [Selaginella moellendorffii]
MGQATKQPPVLGAADDDHAFIRKQSGKRRRGGMPECQEGRRDGGKKKIEEESDLRVLRCCSCCYSVPALACAHNTLEQSDENSSKREGSVITKHQRERERRPTSHSARLYLDLLSGSSSERMATIPLAQSELSLICEDFKPPPLCPASHLSPRRADVLAPAIATSSQNTCQIGL